MSASYCRFCKMSFVGIYLNCPRCGKWLAPGEGKDIAPDDEYEIAEMSVSTPLPEQLKTGTYFGESGFSSTLPPALPEQGEAMTQHTTSDELRKQMGYLGFEWNKWDRSFSMHGTLFRVKPGDAEELIKHFHRFLVNYALADRKQHELDARIDELTHVSSPARTSKQSHLGQDYTVKDRLTELKQELEKL